MQCRSNKAHRTIQKHTSAGGTEINWFGNLYFYTLFAFQISMYLYLKPCARIMLTNVLVILTWSLQSLWGHVEFRQLRREHNRRYTRSKPPSPSDFHTLRRCAAHKVVYRHRHRVQALPLPPPFLTHAQTFTPSLSVHRLGRANPLTYRHCRVHESMVHFSRMHTPLELWSKRSSFVSSCVFSVSLQL